MEINPHQIYEVDFIKLDRALRDNGLKPEKYELAGIPHFSLTGQHAHLCCGLCTLAARSSFMKDNVPSAEMKKLNLAKPPEVTAGKDGYGDIVADVPTVPTDPKDPFKTAVGLPPFKSAIDK